MKIAIEPHSHFYENFSIENYLNSFIGHVNLTKNHPDLFCIVINDTNKFRCFEIFKNSLTTNKDLFKNYFKKNNILFFSYKNNKFCVIKGIQVITRENIEVLIFPYSDTNLTHGLPFLNTIEKAKKNEKIIAIPWGFGKWIGNKKSIIKKAIEENFNYEYFFLVDSYSRVFKSLNKEIFTQATKLNVTILGGSDPFPITKDDKINGALFTLIETSYKIEEILTEEKKLFAKENTYVLLGYRENKSSFIKRQFKINIKKYLKI